MEKFSWKCLVIWDFQKIYYQDTKIFVPQVTLGQNSGPKSYVIRLMLCYVILCSQIFWNGQTMKCVFTGALEIVISGDWGVRDVKETHKSHIRQRISSSRGISLQANFIIPEPICKGSFSTKASHDFFFHPILSNHDKVSVLRLLGYDSPFHLLLDI